MWTAGTCGFAMWATRLIPVAKKLGSSSCAVDARGEFGREAPADGRDVHSDLLEDLAVHLAADAAASGLAVRIGAVPWRERESRVASRLTLDRLEFPADAVAQRFEPVAGGLLLFVESQHGAGL